MNNEHMDKLAAAGEPAAPEPEDTVESLKMKFESSRLSQASIDRQNRELRKKNAELEAQLLKGGSEAQLLARLDKIERAAAARARALEVQFYARSKALEAGIPYEVLADLDLPDEPAVERKISQITSAVEAATLAGVEKKLGSSPKPQAGQSIREALEPEPDRLAAKVAKELRGLNRN